MYGNFWGHQQPMYQPMYQSMYQPMYQPMYQQPGMFPGASHFGFNQVHCLGSSDIDFMEKLNLPYDMQKLRDDMNSTEISDVLTHRKYQEMLLDKYGYYSDKKAWRKNCKIIHEYDNGKYDKK